MIGKNILLQNKQGGISQREKKKELQRVIPLIQIRDLLGAIKWILTKIA
jgi:hypothetical protein